MKPNLRNKTAQVNVLIIDEISMFSNDFLLHVRCRLVEIFGCRTDIPFAWITIIAVGDFCSYLQSEQYHFMQKKNVTG